MLIMLSIAFLDRFPKIDHQLRQTHGTCLDAVFFSIDFCYKFFLISGFFSLACDAMLALHRKYCKALFCFFVKSADASFTFPKFRFFQVY